MEQDTNIYNAVIRWTTLSNDYGHAPLSLAIEIMWYEGKSEMSLPFYIGLGHIRCEEDNNWAEEFVGYQRTAHIFDEILTIAESKNWEHLAGKHIRIKVREPMGSMRKIVAIGNILKNHWLDVEKYFAKYPEVEKNI